MSLRRVLFSAAILGAACQTTAPGDHGPGGKTDDPTEEGTLSEIAGRIGDAFQSVMDRRHPPGTTNVKRAVFLKPHGCAQARFEIFDLPEHLRVGLFAEPAAKDAWVRISSDTVPQQSDHANNTIGFSIKVLGVPGEKILTGEEQFTTHDFLLQNHHVFFVDTALDFLEFTDAALGGTIDQYLAEHPTTDQILKDMEHPVASILGVTFHSTTPYRFGDFDHVKYKLIPCTEPPAEDPPPTSDRNYLKTRLIRDLGQLGACYELQVQLRAGEDMPLDAATVAWDETVSEPVSVARLTIDPQEITQHDGACENMSFTAWHALPAHRPVGSVNEARGFVYKRLADYRRGRNQIPISEPEPFSE